MFIQVKYNNSLSGEVKVTQGVRQGAKLSTMLYKRYNNNILKALERSEIGAEIGSSRQDSKYCHLLTSRSGASRGCGRPIDNNISRNLLHNKETLEFKILESMAKRNGQSYIIKVIQRLEKYGLPEIETLLENESDTLKWKKTVKKHIIHYCDVKWQEEKQQKRRTKKSLEHSKVLYRKHKKGTYKDLDNGQLMKLILDSTCESVRTSIRLKKDNYTDIEQITRTLCYGLHERRTYLLKDET
ncbi:unnamed protein product [Mytilus edulis]|uniref:Reverse transcriptase domain-containing protein n=1 Tax=Mytilus edulis TaxID=6550 RepID=A0A8S3TNV7_MYTED|nr:unnamed protein product [Mytilus edulis]